MAGDILCWYNASAELSINITEALVQLALSLTAEKTFFLYTYTCINWEKCIYWGREQKKFKWLTQQAVSRVFLAISSHHIACNYWNITILYELQLPVAFMVSWKICLEYDTEPKKKWALTLLWWQCISHPTEFSESATYRATLSVSSRTTGFIWLCVSSTSAGTASLLTEHIALDSSS